MYNRSRKDLKALITARFPSLLTEDFGGRLYAEESTCVLIWHFGGLRADQRAIEDAVSEADFETLSANDLFTKVKVRKCSKLAKAEAAAVAKKAEEEAYYAEEARAEQQFEMLAAFGPGETVVNIITGETYRT